MKKVYYISKEVSDYLYADAHHDLNIVNIGVLLFQRNVSKQGGAMECIFRVVQDGIINIVAHMTKRIVRTRNVVVIK